MVRFIILLIILVLALSYFGISIRNIVESPTGQDNFSFVWAHIKDGWEILVVWIAGLIQSIKNIF
ncbi:hypothetical protein KJ819_01950 [Patescibacteria group bacterium]|nr:hypothetical protein [Patescibacteria group bacterium]MBU1500953.1 hypothetical protein [Patescibacteria group bacterium]MBU2080583.1 hypothetical protein [Patescibacteria group bacterium]MBU2124341.1 hypothetical protein [Patescibacteria group bacterium]MBU2194467.1 hypothetical protein [Patescibacteria group bacterium]